MLKLPLKSQIFRFPLAKTFLKNYKPFPSLRFFSNDTQHYDICVIGCGPAGYAATMRAWDYKKKICVIEKGRVGGAGLHNGALSSKTMWELSRDYRKVLVTDRGFRASSVELNFKEVMKAVSDAQADKEKQMVDQLIALNIPLIKGYATFENSKEICVESEGGKKRKITADHFVIATGSRPRKLDSMPADGKYIMNSDHIELLQEFPKSIAIIGAGIIGCEFATIFANFGQTKVYLIDKADRILPFEDEDIAKVCSTNMERNGVHIHHGVRLESVKAENGKVNYEVVQAKTGKRETITVDSALLAIGREPNIDNIGLDKAGVKVNKAIIDNVDGQTNIPHIWAVGDSTFDVALVNIGEIEGRHVVERIYGGEVKPIQYKNVSTIMFLDPEVAAVGMNEVEARKQKIPYKVAYYDYSLVSRALAQRSTTGLVKLLVSNDDKMRVLGIRALGTHSSSLIEVVSLMVKSSESVRVLADLLVAYPSVAEGLQECVRLLLNSSIYKPQVFPEHVHVNEVHF